jgi:hypothetical protein
MHKDKRSILVYHPHSFRAWHVNVACSIIDIPRPHAIRLATLSDQAKTKLYAPGAKGPRRNGCEVTYGSFATTCSALVDARMEDI